MKLLVQIKRNQLAIISLIVALTALGYNTWRNELTEHNRNTRAAGFEMLVHISTLQRIVYLAHYDKDKVGGNPRAGWTEILVLQDFANLMSPEVQISTSILATIWGDNWDDLGKEELAVTSVDNAIDQLRKDVLAALLELD